MKSTSTSTSQNGTPSQLPSTSQHTSESSVRSTPLRDVGHTQRDVSDQLPLEVQRRQAAFQTQTALPVLSNIPRVDSIQFTAADLLGLPGSRPEAPVRSGTRTASIDPVAQAKKACDSIGSSSVTPIQAVSIAGESFSQLLGENQLEAARSVLKSLAKKFAPLIELNASGPLPHAVIDAMGDFESPILSHLMGSSHFFEVKLTLASYWLRRLRFVGSSGAYDRIVSRYAPAFNVPASRPNALKGLMAHLSWMVPVWSMPAAVKGQKDFLAMRSALVQMIQLWDKTYVSLRSSRLAQEIFLEEVQAAIVPAYCSTRMAHALKDIRKVEGVPSWVSDPLRLAAQSVMDDEGPKLFPMDRHGGLIHDAPELAPSTAQKRAREPGGGDGSAKRPKENGFEGALGLSSQMGATPGGLGAQILPAVAQVTAVMDPSVEATRAVASIAEASTSPLRAVSFAGEALVKLFPGNHLEAAGTVLKALGFKLRELEGMMGRSSAQSQSAVLAKMAEFGPPICSTMMGACYSYRSKDVLKTRWYASLRLQRNVEVFTYEDIVTHYEPSLALPEKRSNALCATVAHLSWLAPPWHPGRVKADKTVYRQMQGALAKLFDTWERAYAKSDGQAFLAQILAAIVPAYCSPRMADALRNVQGVPDWLDGPLRAKAQAILDDTGPRLFPMGWDDVRERLVQEQVPVPEFRLMRAPPINFVPQMVPRHSFLAPANLPLHLASFAPQHFPQHFPFQQPPPQEMSPGVRSGSEPLNNTAVRDMATQAMREYDTGTVEGLRDFLSRMAWLVGLPSTLDLTLTPSQRVASLFVQLQETAIVCASGASHEWDSEQAFWNKVIEELRSPGMNALSQIMAQRAGEELDGRRQSTGATIAMFHQLRAAPPSGSSDPDDWVDSVLGGFGSEPYQGEDLEQLAWSQWTSDDMFRSPSGDGLSRPASNNAAVRRVEFQIPARGTAPVPQSVALPQTPDWGAPGLPQTPVQSATPQTLLWEEPDDW